MSEETPTRPEPDGSAPIQAVYVHAARAALDVILDSDRPGSTAAFRQQLADETSTDAGFRASVDAAFESGRALGFSEGRRGVGARVGYDQAVATLRDVADRTGSPSARYWAEYLTVDPDRRAPAVAVVGPWEPAEQPEPVATGGIIANPGLAIVPEDGCTLTWPPSYSPAEKMRSIRAQPHPGGCICRECRERDEAAEQPEGSDRD